MNSSHFSAVLAGIALILSGPALAQLQPTISVDPARPNPGENFLVTVDGQWPDSCPPELSRSEWREGQLILFATTEVNCASGRSDYRMSAEIEPPTESLSGPVEVKVIAGASDAQLGQLIAFELFSIGDRPEWQPESGIWWPAKTGQFTTSGPGVALSFEFIDDDVVTITSAYDASGAPSWVLGSGKLRDDVMRGTLTKILGGQQLFEHYQPPEAEVADGELRIHFHSPTTATVWLTAPAGASAADGLLLQPISVEHYARQAPQKRLAGRWVLIDEADPSKSVAISFESALTGAESIGLTSEIELLGQNGDAILRCEGQQQVICYVSAFELSYVFDEVGLDRMRGTASNGADITAIKLR